MTILLVRHAHAGEREAWRGDDIDRPLSELGARQSEALIGVLGARPIARVLSSHAARAVQTVEPLAAHLGLPLERDERLWETTPAAQAREWMASLAKEHDDDLVLCSHGDLIEPLMRELERRGLDLDGGPPRGEKGGVWALDFDGDAVVSAVHLRPPA